MSAHILGYEDFFSRPNVEIKTIWGALINTHTHTQRLSTAASANRENFSAAQHDNEQKQKNAA